MKQYNYEVSTIESLNDILISKEISAFCRCQAQLIQIFSAKIESEWYQTLGKLIGTVFPSAIVVGASSVGEISDGKMYTDSTIIIFSFFENSSLHLFSYECKTGNDESIGKTLVKDIESLDLDIKGMLLLSTPVSNDSAKLFNSITACNLTYPVFGGGAGDYSNMRKTLVFDGIRSYNQGVIAVVFSGDDLYVEPLTYLGWHPLSKEMTITEIDPECSGSVKTIDGSPAFLVYKKYLGIKVDDNFFMNVLEFPFLIYRNGQVIARVPFFVNELEGSIQFLADIQVGEKFRIGYGNPQMIIAESINIQNKMLDFQPEAIFLYSCICRRFLMQHDVSLETLPLNKIAPTAGFYTFGEFFANSTYNALLNSTMVAVGLREGTKDKKMQGHDLLPKENIKQNNDPYKHQHTRILSRLLYFINVTIKELEVQNQVLKSLNEQKNEFLGMAAHDLRNPIGAIQSLSELLEKQIGDQYKDYTGMITKTSSEMLNLLNDFLNISKIEAGKLDLKKNEINYITFVEQNIKMNEFFAQNKRINLISDFEMPVQILSIDDGKIGQVLNNLIGNAIKYSYPDSTISIKIFKEGKQIITQVIDHGQGIPGNELAGIFNPYKQTSIKPTGDENSHGLGLAIVKKIIEGHDGSVGVTSEFGKGSVFFFTLPI